MLWLLKALISTTLLLLAHANTSYASQQVLGSPNSTRSALISPSYVGDMNQNPYRPYNEGLFTPLEDLSSLSETEFTHMSHPAFPGYGIRIKKSVLRDTKVNSYTGYMTVRARHLFFYFFESRNDPDTDPVIFWTNGGPGCSSSLAVFMELGPCRITDANGTKYFPDAWNSRANVLFVDQPVGVGYSYADFGEVVGTTEDAAKDIAAFVAVFFLNFAKFDGRAFHMAGESYGGRYIPLFAAEVYDQNAWMTKVGLTPINLTSAIIGNGWTDGPGMVLSYYDMQCTPASLPPVLDIATCVHMKQILPRCEKWLREACTDTYDAINCNAAYQFCNTELSDPFQATGKNRYDISKPCEGEPNDLCYPVTAHISSFLNATSTRHILGVHPLAASPSYAMCSPLVSGAFALTHDQQRAHPTTSYRVAALLERGVKVLIYVGTYDWICNWVGNERWTLELEWSGQEAFRGKELRPWEAVKGSGKRAGRTRSAGGLTYATVDGAGHMVPYDKPKEALALINHWLAGEELLEPDSLT